MRRFGICSTSRSTRVVFPAPEGAETMKRQPGGSLDILDLLAHLLQLRLRSDDQLRYAQAVGLRAHGVDLAIHLLQQEIELAATRLRTVGKRFPVRDVAAESGHLLADVRARRPLDDF